MKKTTILLMTFLMMFAFEAIYAQKETSKERTLNSQNGYIDGEYKPYEVLDTRIDNMRYWRKAAELGLTPYNPDVTVPLGTYKTSRIYASTVVREDSPDVPVTEENSTQSENSIFVDPNDPDHVLQSNNSTQNPVGSLYGANYFFSYDFGQIWGGTVQGAGGGNSGDPATAIGLSGRQYVGFIHSNGGQGISYSDDGTNWTSVLCGTPPGGWDILDKNHMWIDNSPSSPYEGNVYSAWTGFGNSNANEIEFVYSTNDGLSYSSHDNISSAVNAGSHNQGVNITTGPDGQVYAIWAIYDGFPTDETAIGFARSLDGGATFEPAERIITNIRGIRSSETSKNQRVNSFPSATCDISGDGTIFIVWANIGVPGVNNGNDIDVYMIKSSDEGDNWSDAIRVNQDEAGLGHEHYFPWISCDPENSALSVVFYDDRNVGGNKCEVFCANSFDGGETWEDFQVSDVDFTPAPIAGLAGDYMGDYLGISARGGKVYPVWTDNRSGHAMTYTSPYETNSLARPSDLTAAVTFESGEVQLDWIFSDTVTSFQHFIIYRDGFEVGTTTEKTYIDMLPDYGVFKYKVTAMLDGGESSGPSASIQWGDPHVAVDPTEIIENIDLMSTTTRFLTVENVGELDLIYEVTGSTEPIRGSKDYCIPTTNCSFGDGINDFAMADISNMGSGCSPDGYGDFTNMSTEIQAGNTYEVSLGTEYDNQFVTIWIDWNKNEVFDPEEIILQDLELVNSGQLYNTDVTIPDEAQSGETRMRVKAVWQNPSSGDPCEDSSYGETEDYTVSISGWMYVDRIVDTIAPGNTNTVEITFVSEDLSEGTYYGNIKVVSNDPNLPLVDVPVTLNVGGGFPLAIQVVADPSEVCAGDASQLEAIANGGTGTYTYEWTSDPAGFTSSEAEPMVYPEVATTYFVDVNDGENTVSGQTTINIIPLPEPVGMPLGEISLCWGEYQTVYSTDGSVGSDSYNWMFEPVEAGVIEGDGLTATVTWAVTFTGEAFVSVTGVNECGESGGIIEVLSVMMNELPVVDLGEDIEICANEPVLLDAGNPGATYLWSTGETTQTIMVDSTGIGIGSAEFSVEVTDAETCSNSDAIMISFYDCTGISEVADAWSIDVFPNPSNGQFAIDIKSKNNQPVQMRIFNAFGSEVYKENNVVVNSATSKTLNLKNLHEGIYYFNLHGDGVNIIKKIVIQ